MCSQPNHPLTLLCAALLHALLELALDLFFRIRVAERRSTRTGHEEYWEEQYG